MNSFIFSFGPSSLYSQRPLLIDRPQWLFIQSKLGCLFVIQPPVKSIVLSRHAAKLSGKRGQGVQSTFRGSGGEINPSPMLLVIHSERRGASRDDIVFMISFEARTSASWLVGP